MSSVDRSETALRHTSVGLSLTHTRDRERVRLPHKASFTEPCARERFVTGDMWQWSLTSNSVKIQLSSYVTEIITKLQAWCCGFSSSRGDQTFLYFSRWIEQSESHKVKPLNLYETVTLKPLKLYETVTLKPLNLCETVTLKPLNLYVTVTLKPLNSWKIAVPAL